jgi:hypothetical protein
MNYGKTLIDDLPTLDDLEKAKTAGLNMIPSDQTNKYQKFIRNSGFKTPSESGMQMYGNPNSEKYSNPNMTPVSQFPPMQSDMPPEQLYLEEQMYPQRIDVQHPNPNIYTEEPPIQLRTRPKNKRDHYKHVNNMDYNPYQAQVFENYDSSTYKNRKSYNHKDSSGNLSCLHVAEHAHDCMVCSRLYNISTMPYMIAIVILVCIVIWLMVREKQS